MLFEHNFENVAHTAPHSHSLLFSLSPMPQCPHSHCFDIRFKIFIYCIYWDTFSSIIPPCLIKHESCWTPTDNWRVISVVVLGELLLELDRAVVFWGQIFYFRSELIRKNERLSDLINLSWKIRFSKSSWSDRKVFHSSWSVLIWNQIFDLKILPPYPIQVKVHPRQPQRSLFNHQRV